MFDTTVRTAALNRERGAHCHMPHTPGSGGGKQTPSGGTTASNATTGRGGAYRCGWRAFPSMVVPLVVPVIAVKRLRKGNGGCVSFDT